jgi:hypothetical protein
MLGLSATIVKHLRMLDLLCGAFKRRGCREIHERSS